MADEKKLVTTKQVAKFFDRTERRIQQLTSDKILPAVKRTREGNMYDFMPTVQRYIFYLQEAIEKRSKNTEEQEKQRLEAEIKLKEAKAEIAQIDLKELKAEMLRACDVQAFIEDLASTTKALLLGLPGRLAMDLANENTTAEKSAIIEEAIFEVLNQLAEYDFSVEYFKKRVAERHGRSVDNGEEENED